MPTLILALCGSLRAQSSNARLLRVAQQLAPAGLEISIYEGLGDLPHFNPDLDQGAPPPEVADLRAQLDACDAVLICTPEYGHGLPGSFKNALDWTISSGHWMDKHALILKAARSRFAHDSLVEILSTLMARVETCEVFLVGNAMDEAAMLADESVAGAVREALKSLE